MIRSIRRSRTTDMGPDGEIASALRQKSLPLTTAASLDPLMDRIGEAKLVLLGEASHGTHEYYLWRSRISQRLIAEKGFSFIVVEGDWPDCYRIDRYVKDRDSTYQNAGEVLHTFERWPTWMWANEEIVALAEWLRTWNRSHRERTSVGFYGFDVYSLWDSLNLLMGYFARQRPELLADVQRAYRCFEPFGEDVQEYAFATKWMDTSCEEEVIRLLTKALRDRRPQDGEDPEDRFNAEQNAVVLKNAENYYRAMVRGGSQSWNVRDRHMVQTLDRLMQHHGPEAKGIVWAHNTHIGDARYTDMAEAGMVNVGQLVRESYGEDQTVLVGFASHQGSVIAGDAWGAPMAKMTVPPGRPGSWEAAFHEAAAEDRLLLCNSLRGDRAFERQLGHRAIGVVYRPNREHLGNYVPTDLANRYDAVMYLDRTEALQPLKGQIVHNHGEVPQTFPSGQ